MTVRCAFAFLVLSSLPALSSAAAEPDDAAGATRLDASVAVQPVALPDKKGGRREISYAFGKATAGLELATRAQDSLIDRAYFGRRAEEDQADFRLALSLDRASSSHEDFGEWQSRSSTYEVRADVAYRWLDAKGSTVSEGTVDGFARISINGPPRRSDAAKAWTALIDEAVSRAFSEAYTLAAFGNEPPPVKGWNPLPPGTRRRPETTRPSP